MTGDGAPIWCVVEPALGDCFVRLLKRWGWAPRLISPPPANLASEVSILEQPDAPIEAWAAEVLRLVPEDGEALLLIHSELTAARRSAEHGLLLAERLWCERAIPTVLATMDPLLDSRASTRRARTASKGPVLHLVASGSAGGGPSMVLWDLLSGPTGLDAAATTARVLVQESAPEALSKVQDELLGSFLAVHTATLRHRMAGLGASLRILEGGYRDGWVRQEDLDSDAWRELRTSHRDNAQTLNDLDRLRESLQTLPQDNVEPAAPVEQEVWVCDDAWISAGWKLTLTPLLCHRFGFAVRGFLSLRHLQQALREHYSPTEVGAPTLPTLLLDVHLSPTEMVTLKFLRMLHQHYPLLDVVLFTSELKDGVLVRGTYELGYRIFFKQMESSARDPRTYARQLLKMVGESAASLPIRALTQVAEAGIAAGLSGELEDDSISSLRRVLTLWRQTPDPALVFMLLPLLERQLDEACHRLLGHGPDRLGTGGIDWYSSLKELRKRCAVPGRAAWTLVDRLHPVAREVRNNLAHDADVVLKAEALLPAVGCALPIVLAMSALHIGCSDSHPLDAGWDGQVVASLKALCESFLVAAQARQSPTLGYLESACRFHQDRSAMEALFWGLGRVAAANVNLFGMVTKDGSMSRALHLGLPKTPNRGEVELGVFHWTVLLSALGILEHPGIVWPD